MYIVYNRLLLLLFIIIKRFIKQCGGSVDLKITATGRTGAGRERIRVILHISQEYTQLMSNVITSCYMNRRQH